jgi:hypothetical protein
MRKAIGVDVVVEFVKEVELLRIEDGNIVLTTLKVRFWKIRISDSMTKTES